MAAGATTMIGGFGMSLEVVVLCEPGRMVLSDVLRSAKARCHTTVSRKDVCRVVQYLSRHATYRTVEQPLRAGGCVKGSAKASPTPSQRSAKHDGRDNGIECVGDGQSLNPFNFRC